MIPDRRPPEPPSATTWHLKLKTWRKETFTLSETRQLNLLVGYRAGQRNWTISHSNLHFLGAPVPLPHMCHTLISCPVHFMLESYLPMPCWFTVQKLDQLVMHWFLHPKTTHHNMTLAVKTKKINLKSYQLSAASGREYIMTIPKTQMPASQVIKPAQQTQVVPRGQQQSRGQQTSYIVIDNQQPRTSRQLHFTISPTKAFNAPSVASVTGDEVHTTSNNSCIFGNLQSVMGSLSDGYTLPIYTK